MMWTRQAVAGAAAGLLLAVTALTTVGAQGPASGAKNPPTPSTPAAPGTPSPDGPWLGTWKRNNDKSSSSMAGEAIFTMWKDGDGFRYTLVMTPPNGGKPTHMEAFGRFDGQQYPEVGNPSADFNVFGRLNDRAYSLIDVKGGKEMIKFKIFISPDNKTRTSVSTSRNAKGEEVTSLGVWDRIQ